MLNMARVHTTLPIQDLARARAFYRAKLGLEPVEESAAGLTYECGGGRFVLFPSQGKSTGEYTQIGFRVENIESEVSDLRKKGLVFEEYDFPGLKTVNGIATFETRHAAWFKDSEGNLLGIVQFE